MPVMANLITKLIENIECGEEYPGSYKYRIHLTVEPKLAFIFRMEAQEHIVLPADWTPVEGKIVMVSTRPTNDKFLLYFYEKFENEPMDAKIVLSYKQNELDIAKKNIVGYLAKGIIPEPTDSKIMFQ